MPDDWSLEQDFADSPQARLTRRFCQWEKRGRGWQVWSNQVELEPPFIPFFGHYIEQGSPVIDDARRPTLGSSLVEFLKGSSSRAQPAQLPEPEPEEPVPEYISETLEIVEIRVSLPQGQAVKKAAVEQLLLGLKYCSAPLSFEVIGLSRAIHIQFACRPSDRSLIRQQLRSYFPDVVLGEAAGFLKDVWDTTDATESVIVDFGLCNEFMLPVQTFKDFDIDPLIAVTGALSELEEAEIGLLQILFQPVRWPWSESVLRAVADWEGKPFFKDAPQVTSLAKEKISKPLFAVVIRIGAQSPVYGRSWEIARALGGALLRFNNPASNELMPLDDSGYSYSDHEVDVLSRQTHRSGMILNSDELVSLVHLPSPSVRAEKLKREEKRTKAAPAMAVGHKLVLGENTHAGKQYQVTLAPEHRIRHTYVIGASGTGKSTLLLNLIVQDIGNGEGVGVLDPHGDLIDQVLGYIPEDRFEDVVLLDPSDEEYPVGFNILTAHSELEKTLLASDLVSVFRRLSTSWGDQMTSVLGNAILAFLESKKGGTLAALRRFLVESDFRKEFLKTVRDPEVVYYWQKTFSLLSGKPQAPLLTRLDTFLRPKLIRSMVGQKENRINFEEIMNQGKILLAKLAQGAIGEENAYLLGTLLVAKIHQIAMGRQEIQEAARRNFYVYVDEFQNFITPSMAAVLAGARKYHLGLTLAHQELRQLWNRDTEVASAVISNPYTRICFRLGDFDAQKLADGYSFFEAKDLQNLGIGEAICRIERREYDFNLKTFLAPEVDRALADRRRESITDLSRRKYGRKRQEVEAELLQDRIHENAGATTIAGKGKAQQLRPQAPQADAPETLPGPILSEKQTASAPGERVPEIPMKKSAPLPDQVPKETRLAGRGSNEHKYLQNYIKQFAERLGYKVLLEREVLDGVSRVDVAMEKDGRSIACEVSVTSTPDQEVAKIQKCLAAGFDDVILVSSDERMLDRARDEISTVLNNKQSKRVRFLTPEQLLAFIKTTQAKAGGRGVVDQDGDELLTAKELESLLRIDIKTIYSYVQRGLIPYVRIQSNVRFRKADILDWIADRRFKPRSLAERK